MPPFETLKFEVGANRRGTEVNFNLNKTLGKVSSQDAGLIFRNHLPSCIRQMVSDVMAAEVNEPYEPKQKRFLTRLFSQGLKTLQDSRGLIF